MGKRRAKKKKRRVQSERQRRAGHESGPETATGRERRDAENGDSCSPPWNSLDEESLADYAKNAAAGESGEEVEVAKLLSFLNFSVIPCALEPYNLECEVMPHAPNGGGGPPTDVDLLSELTSATHLEKEDGREGEEEDGRGKRGSRKRTSRRRPNKRTKKLRSSSAVGPAVAAAGEFMCLCHFVRAGGEKRVEEERKRGRSGPFTAGSPRRDAVTSMNTSGYYCERCCGWGGGGGRGKTARRKVRGERFDPLARTAGPGRWGQGRGARSESSTPVNLPTHSVGQQYLVEMDCENGEFSTDTSATGEVDMGAEPDDSDHTPPADPSPGDLYEEERVEESELSDTTTDR